MCMGTFTVVANHIVHVSSRSIAVFSRIKQHGFALDSRETAKSAESSRASANDHDLIVGLGHRSRQSDGQG